MSINGIVPKLMSARREITRATRMQHAQIILARTHASAKADFQETVENVCLYASRRASMAASALRPTFAIVAAVTRAHHARRTWTSVRLAITDVLAHLSALICRDGES